MIDLEREKYPFCPLYPASQFALCNHASPAACWSIPLGPEFSFHTHILLPVVAAVSSFQPLDLTRPDQTRPGYQGMRQSGSVRSGDGSGGGRQTQNHFPHMPPPLPLVSPLQPRRRRARTERERLPAGQEAAAGRGWYVDCPKNSTSPSFPPSPSCLPSFLPTFPFSRMVEAFSDDRHILSYIARTVARSASRTPTTESWGGRVRTCERGTLAWPDRPTEEPTAPLHCGGKAKWHAASIAFASPPPPLVLLCCAWVGRPSGKRVRARSAVVVKSEEACSPSRWPLRREWLGGWTVGGGGGKWFARS